MWQEAIGTIRGRYFILTRQELDAQTAKEWGAVNEIVPADKLLPRAREIAEGLAKLPSLTTKYTRIAMTQKLRRIIDEGVTLGLALEGSALPMSREGAKNEQRPETRGPCPVAQMSSFGGIVSNRLKL